jgi:hypothetical protein
MRNKKIMDGESTSEYTRNFLSNHSSHEGAKIQFTNTSEIANYTSGQTAIAGFSSTNSGV